MPSGEIKKTIFEHVEFAAFTSGVNSIFAKWLMAATHTLKGVAIGAKPKALIISQGKFRSMRVQVPALPEQTAIAAVLSDMDAEIAALEARRDRPGSLSRG